MKKRHELFRRAISVSVQARRELYPEITDIDVEKALRTLADASARERYKRRQAERDAAIQAIMDKPRVWHPLGAKRPAEDLEVLRAERQSVPGSRRRNFSGARSSARRSASYPGG
jgi:hypothetical protein